MKTFFREKSSVEELRANIKQKSLSGTINAALDWANEKLGLSGTDHMLDMPMDVQRKFTKEIKPRDAIEAQKAESKNLKDGFGIDANLEVSRVHSERKSEQQKNSDKIEIQPMKAAAKELER